MNSNILFVAIATIATVAMVAVITIGSFLGVAAILTSSEWIEMRDLRPGDRFKMFDTARCPEQRLIARRAPDIDLNGPLSPADSLALISNEVFTLQRSDGGEPYEISLDAFTPVVRTKKGPR